MAIFRRTPTKPTADRTLDPSSSGPLMLSGQAEGVGTSGALRLADAYACIRALSDAAASLPLHTYRRTDQGRVRTAGRTADLLRRPAPATSTANFIGQAMAHLLIYGNAYVGKYREDGRIERLSLIPPDRVRPVMESGRLSFQVSTNGGMIVCDESDVIHVRAMSTDGLLGLSPVAQARQILTLNKSLAGHASATFENAGRLSGVLKVPNSGREQLDRLRASWETGHSGSSNAGKVAILSGEVEFTPLSMPLTDAQFLEQRKLSAVEVSRIFRLPPWVIGAETGDSLTYTNTVQQTDHFVKFSLRPWLVVIEQALTNDRDLCPGSAYCEFVLDGLLRADPKTRAEIYEKALDAETGWMRRDEVRQLENLEPENEST